ncbi:MAG: Gfo/Idh/MocA family oxidoreductase [Planctomycetes bacterium]|nr:Gfo/Idh/MocA family oxidoreductase [Planctomycetota bacterium]
MTQQLPADTSRRSFLGAGGAAAAAAFAAPIVLTSCRATPSTAGARLGPALSGGRELTVGVIGCGGRGGGAAFDALKAGPKVRIVALGDVFEERVRGVAAGLARAQPDRGTVPDSRQFHGFDAYRKVLATDCDIVVLATAPGFRPAHYAAAIDAGKHVFFEKPVAVDPSGVRTVLEASARAAERRLCVVTGTQRRHERCYLEAMALVQDGAIGRPIAAACYWNQGGLWHKDPDPKLSEMENQVRNWLYHTWLSGDHIVEQHVHNIDVVNWAMGGPPVRCVATGGRQARTEPIFGAINDHFSVHYEYEGDRLCASMCRQQEGTDGRVDEVIHGTEGTLLTSSGRAEIRGRFRWTFAGDNPNPYVQEHVDLQEAVRGNAPYLNEGKRIAESTMTAILGRMAAYTGKDLSFAAALADPMDLVPKDPKPGPGVMQTVAIPGMA